MGTAYQTDIVAWSKEQAALLRSGQLDAIDAVNVAEEIEDVGRSEQHELSSRLAVLLAHLLKWKYQSHLRGASWEKTIREQRRAVARRLKRAPSLKHMFSDEEWLDETWDDAARLARNETGFSGFPDHWIWTPDEVLDPNFFPD